MFAKDRGCFRLFFQHRMVYQVQPILLSERVYMMQLIPILEP